ncbi:MAG: sulfate adenylyltransferase subunit CysN [Balneolales bacterium]|nr:sulfate adenylyltransferase subunit CysN [Balneolales bacterium]
MSTANTSNTPKTQHSDTSYLQMDLLRFTTAGSVDDGKSTLIGRLLYDSKSIFQDQMDAIESSSKLRGEEGVNLALLTDGLRAEREQGITIDVAYRYFATPKRKFIIADTPGHTQYTRNMVTGASTADLAIILVDARKGVLTQSRRHAFISSLLQIPHLVVAVNKMDLVDYDQDRYNEIVDDFRKFAAKLEVDDITYIPMSALNGDNIVNKSEKMSWYDGTTLLHHLENVKVGSRRNQIDFRFPVQFVIRPNQDFRGYAGTIASGTIRKGDEVMVLPSRLLTQVKSITTYDGDLDEANAGDAVTISLNDEIDISRGDMIVRSQNIPKIGQLAEAYVCWMNEAPMEIDKNYLIQHTTRITQVRAEKINYKINIDTLHREDAEVLQLNEIGRLRLNIAQPIFYDAYNTNNATGSFIVIDPATNVTVGAGMLRTITTSDRLDQESVAPQAKPKVTPNVVWEPWNVPREVREKRYGHKARVLWLTGISGAGKSTIARKLEQKLWDAGKQTVLLDGDQVRHGLNGDLGFSDSDRQENIRRVAHAARLFLEHGNIVICTFVSPFAADREMAKEIIGADDFSEILIHCDRDTAINRDPKGLYAKAKSGEIKGLTGYDAPYEAPENPDLSIDTTAVSEEEAIGMILDGFELS